MQSIISKIILFEESIPFIFWSAICFYAALAAVILVPPVRSKIAKIFQLPPPSNRYILFLDVVRGLSILWVASFHTWQWLPEFNADIGTFFIKQGFKGVIIFAILSGFLVWNSLSKMDISEKGIGHFIKARFIRIFPLLLVTSLYSLLMGHVAEGALGSQDIMADIFMLRVYSYSKIINPVAWFIHALVFFYIISPLWFIATRRFRLLSAVIAFIVLCLMDTNHTVREFQILRHFVLGIIIWEVAARIKGPKPQWGWLFLAVGLPMAFLDISWGRDFISEWLVLIFRAIGVNLSLKTDAFTSLNYTSITFGIGFSLFLLGVLKISSMFDKLSFYPLRFLGLISYSLYLWHGILIITDFPITFNGAGGLLSAQEVSHTPILGDFSSLIGLYFPSFIFIAALSYAIIERPSLRLLNRAKS